MSRWHPTCNTACKTTVVPLPCTVGPCQLAVGHMHARTENCQTSRLDHMQLPYFDFAPHRCAKETRHTRPNPHSSIWHTCLLSCSVSPPGKTLARQPDNLLHNNDTHLLHLGAAKAYINAHTQAAGRCRAQAGPSKGVKSTQGCGQCARLAGRAVPGMLLAPSVSVPVPGVQEARAAADQGMTGVLPGRSRACQQSPPWLLSWPADKNPAGRKLPGSKEEAAAGALWCTLETGKGSVETHTALLVC